VNGPHEKNGPLPAIAIKNLTVAFQGKKILKDFSLNISAGERVVVTGESGLGKSTLLRCILGFVPCQGEISVQGIPLSSQTIWEIRHRLAFVPQEPELGEGILREWLERPFTFRANTHLKGNLKQLQDFLDRFHLPSGLLDKAISTLSGGEKQRMALIAALLLERKILLMDEPTSALDATNSERVGAYLQSLENTTILSVSHDGALLNLFDRAINLPREEDGHGR